MFLIPAISITARAGPPAITPVPSGAFFSSTEALPNFPITSCVMLSFSSNATLIRFLAASSFPLRIASGISVAFPKPAPTWPFPSPTTTKAVNLKLRPPLTTLVTRLIDTTFSVNSKLLASMRSCLICVLPSLEIQSSFSSCIC